MPQNIVDTVHMPASKMNACCTGIEIADAINGAIVSSNRVRKVARGYGCYFGGGIAPSSHGVISNNAIEGAAGYGIWINSRGGHASTKFPNGNSGPTVNTVVVGNCLRANAPAGIRFVACSSGLSRLSYVVMTRDLNFSEMFLIIRCDNASDEAIVGNTVSDTNGAAGLLLVGGNHSAAVVGNVAGCNGAQPPTALHGVLVRDVVARGHKAKEAESSFFLCCTTSAAILLLIRSRQRRQMAMPRVQEPALSVLQCALILALTRLQERIPDFRWLEWRKRWKTTTEYFTLQQAILWK
eukprot:SAG31_NODE_401_length_16206_cov_10.920780_7_plen_296_part_00